MADSKISALPSATTPLAGTEVLPIVQSGATDQVTVANLTAGRAVSVLSLTSTNDSTINGVKVGTGAGSIASNTAVGASALTANTTGASNSAFGNGAGQTLTSANGNTAIGYRALLNADSANNTCIGSQAGSSLSSGAGNICIGSGAQPSSGTVSNEATLTNAAITNTRLYGTIQALNNNFVVVTTGKGLTTGSSIPLGFGTNNGTAAMTLNTSGSFSIFQATTAAAPTYVKGAMYFDTTLNKLRIGGATAWETVTSA